jgi:hypothetical protein
MGGNGGKGVKGVMGGNGGKGGTGGTDYSFCIGRRFHGIGGTQERRFVFADSGFREFPQNTRHYFRARLERQKLPKGELIDPIATQLRHCKFSHAIRSRFSGRPPRVVESDFDRPHGLADARGVVAMRKIEGVAHHRLDTHFPRLPFAEPRDQAMPEKVNDFGCVFLGGFDGGGHWCVIYLTFFCERQRKSCGPSRARSEAVAPTT